MAQLDILTSLPPCCLPWCYSCQMALVTSWTHTEKEKIDSNEIETLFLYNSIKSETHVG